MLRINDAVTEQELGDLKMTLLKCKNCSCVATLKRFLQKRDGELSEMALRQMTFNANFQIHINEIEAGYIYLTISTKRKADIKQLISFWDTVNKRGTQNFLENKPNDYRLVLDLVNPEMEKNTVYVLSFMQPIFISDDGRATSSSTSYTFRLFFTMNNVFYGVEHVSAEALDYEMEQNNAQAQGVNTVYEDDEATEDTSDGDDVSQQVINNDDIINNV